MKRLAAGLAGLTSLGLAVWHGLSVLGGFPWSEIIPRVAH